MSSTMVFPAAFLGRSSPRRAAATAAPSAVGGGGWSSLSSIMSCLVTCSTHRESSEFLPEIASENPFPAGFTCSSGCITCNN